MKHPNRYLRALPMCCALLLPCASAQTPNPKLTFEVASIKLSEPGSVSLAGDPTNASPELLNLRAVPLNALLFRAFRRNGSQFSGPAWLDQLDAARYDISAKVPPGSSSDDIAVMVEHLLVERFGLRFHREVREVLGYELVLAKNGSKLKESGQAAPGSANGDPYQMPTGKPGMMRFMSQGMAVITGTEQTSMLLASLLESTIGKPVVDKTGLTGKYDFGFAFDAADMSPGLRPQPVGGAATSTAPSVANLNLTPSLNDALQQELGLRLNQKKLPVDFVVIDQLEKTPTDN